MYRNLIPYNDSFEKLIVNNERKGRIAVRVQQGFLSILNIKKNISISLYSYGGIQTISILVYNELKPND